jgi:Ca2+-binding EF-hand superfamily protein
MNQLITLAAALAILACSVVSASAADKAAKKRDPEQVFKRLDTNSDGKVSKEEFSRLADRLAKKLDADKAKETATRLFEKLDADKDGSISAEEAKKIAEVRREVRKAAKKAAK